MILRGCSGYGALRRGAKVRVIRPRSSADRAGSFSAHTTHAFVERSVCRRGRSTDVALHNSNLMAGRQPGCPKGDRPPRPFKDGERIISLAGSPTVTCRPTTRTTRMDTWQRWRIENALCRSSKTVGTRFAGFLIQRWFRISSLVQDWACTQGGPSVR